METKSVEQSNRNAVSRTAEPLTEDQLQTAVDRALAATPFIDMHTHLYPPTFGKLGLWGIDQLVTYHYLEAELFRFSSIKPEEYWQLSKTKQADIIWKTLFVENTPLSEATRGVVAVLQAFGLPTDASDLTVAREFFREQTIEQHAPRALKMAGLSTVVMTNDPLDPAEAAAWKRGSAPDPQFQAVLRLDRIVRSWQVNWQSMAGEGYSVDETASGKSIAEIRRFLADWHGRMHPVYMAISLPDTFMFPDDTLQSKILREAVLPSCRELNLPLTLMIGVRYQVNPRLRLAGDGVGRADLRALENLCRDYPENRFLVSILSRENQHELCIYARKFSNLMPFGCWWFLNSPSVVEEITRERLEVLGTSFIPQHSDARVLEQVIYKWRNTRLTIGPILTESYRRLSRDGRGVTRQDIERDVNRLFRSNFESWTA